MSFCTRHCHGDRASIRVWCSQGGVHLRNEITSADETGCRLRQALERVAIVCTVHLQYSTGMKPYSQDLRDRIIQALEARTATQRMIAERFCVSSSFVEKLWQRWRRSGSSAAKPHAGGRQSPLKDHLEILRSEVAKHPDATLADLRDRLIAAQGPPVSTATLCRALQRLKLPLKKSRSTLRNAARSASRRSVLRSGRLSRPSTFTA
jgi:transposase